MLFLDAGAVREALPMEDAVSAMAEAMCLYSGGRVTQPLRTILRPESDNGVFACMPCHVAGDDHVGYGVKAIALRPDNHARGLPAHVGVLMIFHPETGLPLAIIDAAALTAVRTAAASAVATDALAMRDAGDLAILGAGVQARSHLEAMAVVRKLRRVRVWSRTPARAEEFCRWAASLDIDVEVASSVGNALEGGDIVCTTTSAKEPVVSAEHLADGAHVNAVGASTRDARELHAEAVARCSVFVDSRESARGESADLGVPRDLGLLSGDDFPELGEVLLGDRAGRRDDREITLYKSLGLAAQDVVAGITAARVAAGRGIGVSIPFGV